ncbi:ABC transporter permease [Paenibacillus sp. 598K]|uniref:carbohydrate ABC transporter permease n=1 Tax=Paenibacillus sp. 598K TaxID=1117987 RepID=UPI000FFACEF4|nr:carbohydrate ABC transporter permease [Paenibacillus sp. 598K]GBF74381.1 ABC transporter permease [Paenibacillus sp. 598K]
MTRRPGIGATLRHLVVWAVSLVMLIPLLLILLNSFKTQGEAASMSFEWPNKWEFSNYSIVIESGKLLQSFGNSMLYSVTSVVLGIILCSMAAFVLSRKKTRWNRFIYFFIVLGIAMPVNHIALIKVMQAFNLMNTQVGLSLLYTALQIPFSVFLVYGFVSTVPRELDEAGVMDGCGSNTLFFRVIFPLLMPVAVTVMLLNFLASWNEFIFPLYYLNSSSLWPMTLAVYNFFGRYETAWNLVSADIVLTSLPVIVIYLLGQRYIVSGMTAGSVKG